VKTRASKGYRIIYVGHEGHEEAVGTMAVAPDSIDRVETIEEVAALPNIDGAVALLAQTTLSHRDWSAVAQAVRVKYPQVWSPGKSDLCFATTNRQSALMEIAGKCDTVVVIGSSNSSNTMALARLAADLGCKHVLRVNSEEEIPLNLSGTVGVTAGASAPEELVSLVIGRLNPKKGVVEVKITTEDEYFPPPRNIRSLQQAVERAAKTMVGGASSIGTMIDDRSISASRVLEQMQSSV
jgi:4-hydroxy-3-methylbut-2-enyl diphosphate reductase